jgi:pimeloyl-ACP methyl ester carboxylesterase
MRSIAFGVFLVILLGFFDCLDGKNVTISKNFEPEIHRVQTTDGYTLELQRISANRKVSKGSILLVHGLGLTSKIFHYLREDSLAYVLWEKGYDVWLGNSRENSISHQYLPKKSKKFWNFSFHEIGIFDLPAMIDYILASTKEDSLYYFGYSQGGAAGLVLLSQRPEYNRKIRQIHLVAPAIFMAEKSTNMFYLNLELMVGSNLIPLNHEINYN